MTNPKRAEFTDEEVEAVAKERDRLAAAVDRVLALRAPAGSEKLGPDFEAGLAKGMQLARAAIELAALTPCDDLTCTTRSHWAVGRINHGDTPTTCTHGQDHPDTLACEYACSATTAGYMCGRREHPGDRCHQWTMTDEEYDRRREEAGVPREVFDDVRAWADGREAAQRRLTAGCSDRGGECGQMDESGAAGGSDRHVAPLADIMTAIETGCDMVTYSLRPQSNAQQTVDAMHAAVALLRETVMRYTGPTVAVDARSLETGEPVPVSVTVRKVADPLDEDDHRPRHDMDGDHWVRVTDMVGDAEACWWATGGPDGSSVNDIGELDAIFGPLTFCDCP